MLRSNVGPIALLIAVLATTAAVQTASAGEHHSRRAADQATQQRTNEQMNAQVRGANAYLRDDIGSAYSDTSRYQNGAAAAPAGR